MNKQEFREEYLKLIEEYPQVFESKTRMALIEKHVLHLDAKWWKSLVERIIITNNPRFDISEAARSETHAINAINRTRDTIEAYQRVTQGVTDEGLKTALNAFGAKSVWDAVSKSIEKES